MPDEWKTIRVPKDVFEDAKQRKDDHDVTWGQYLNPHSWHSVFDEPTDLPEGREAISSLTVETEDLRPMIREELANAMDEITIDVTVDADSDVDEDDVRNIVDAKLDELRRQLQ